MILFVYNIIIYSKIIIYMNSIVSGLGLAILILFTLPKILNFYGFSIDTYGPYLAFFIFIIISSFILPRNFTNMFAAAPIPVTENMTGV